MYEAYKQSRRNAIALAAFVVWLSAQALVGTRQHRIESQVKETVIGQIEQEYPKYRFGDVLGEWEISKGSSEDTYIITTEVRKKKGMSSRGSVCVEAVRDQDGNITIISETFTGIDVK